MCIAVYDSGVRLQQTLKDEWTSEFYVISTQQVPIRHKLTIVAYYRFSLGHERVFLHFCKSLWLGGSQASKEVTDD